MGYLYSAENDYEDVFGKRSVTGKTCSDIHGNKCTWLVVTCMGRASPEQKKILGECYGSKDPEKIMRVTQVFEEVGMREAWNAFKNDMHKQVLELLKISPIPREAFLWYFRTHFNLQ